MAMHNGETISSSHLAELRCHVESEHSFPLSSKEHEIGAWPYSSTFACHERSSKSKLRWWSEQPPPCSVPFVDLMSPRSRWHWKVNGRIRKKAIMPSMRTHAGVLDGWCREAVLHDKISCINAIPHLHFLPHKQGALYWKASIQFGNVTRIRYA